MPTTLTEAAADQSTYRVTAAFTDSAGTSVTPDSIVWQLTNFDGVTVNSRSGTTVAVPAASVDIVLSGNDLKASDGQGRILTIRAVYDSATDGNNLPLKEEATFQIEDLRNV